MKGKKFTVIATKEYKDKTRVTVNAVTGRNPEDAGEFTAAILNGLEEKQGNPAPDTSWQVITVLRGHHADARKIQTHNGMICSTTEDALEEALRICKQDTSRQITRNWIWALRGQVFYYRIRRMLGLPNRAIEPVIVTAETQPDGRPFKCKKLHSNEEL